MRWEPLGDRSHAATAGILHCTIECVKSDDDGQEFLWWIGIESVADPIFEGKYTTLAGTQLIVRTYVNSIVGDIVEAL